MLPGMDSTERMYNLGPAGSLADERPSVADLQRARLHALRAGDRRRAAAYAALVERRGRAGEGRGRARPRQRPTLPKAVCPAADDLSVRPSSSTTVRPGRFQLHGLVLEVQPAPAGGWDARVITPALAREWHHGRRAWDAIDAAAFAHLASAPADETYRRLLAPSAAADAERLRGAPRGVGARGGRGRRAARRRLTRSRRGQPRLH